MSKEAKPDAWMPLYIGDWDSGTRHLDCEEDGAYGRLVRHYWKNGPLPDDDAKLARIVGMELRRWKKTRLALAGFFIVGEGIWRHRRVDAELVRWAEKRRRAIERAAAGGRGKAAKSSATSRQQAVLEQCTSASATEVDAPTGQSTLCRRERPEARHEGASDLRVIEGGVTEREAWGDALRQALLDVEHFAQSDPDFASEIAEFVDVATSKLGELEAAA